MTYIYDETPWDTDGPRSTWQNTQAEFTPEIRDQLREAAKTKTYPACPQCGQPVETLEQTSVSIQRRIGAQWEEEGSLVTLRPCGHCMKTIVAKQ